jgi:hypothetical protein
MTRTALDPEIRRRWAVTLRQLKWFINPHRLTTRSAVQDDSPAGK